MTFFSISSMSRPHTLVLITAFFSSIYVYGADDGIGATGGAGGPVGLDLVAAGHATIEPVPFMAALTQKYGESCARLIERLMRDERKIMVKLAQHILDPAVDFDVESLEPYTARDCFLAAYAFALDGKNVPQNEAFSIMLQDVATARGMVFEGPEDIERQRDLHLAAEQIAIARNAYSKKMGRTADNSAQLMQDDLYNVGPAANPGALPLSTPAKKVLYAACALLEIAATGVRTFSAAERVKHAETALQLVISLHQKDSDVFIKSRSVPGNNFLYMCINIVAGVRRHLAEEPALLQQLAAMAENEAA